MKGVSEKSAKVTKCECGRVAESGSVFCADCKTAIEKKNTKILNRETALYNRKYFAGV